MKAFCRLSSPSFLSYFHCVYTPFHADHLWRKGGVPYRVLQIHSIYSTLNLSTTRSWFIFVIFTDTSWDMNKMINIEIFLSMRNIWKLQLQIITDSSGELIRSSCHELWSWKLQRRQRAEKIMLFNTLDPSVSLPSTYLNQNTKKSPGDQVCTSYITGEMEMDNFGYLNGSCLISIV